MRAMVLAAGLGTRLRPLTDRVPKPLVPVGLETALGRWFRVLRAAGVSDVVVNLHHMGDAIRSAALRDPPPGLSVSFSEEPEILGTGGGVKKALPRLGPDPFLVVNADAVLEPDVAALALAHRRSGALATLLVRRDPDASRFGAVEADASGRVLRLLGAPATPAVALETFMFTGVQIVDPKVAGLLPEKGCIVRTLHRALVDRGAGLGAFVHEGPWFDVGSLAGYLAGNAWIAGAGVLAHPTASVDPGARVGPSVVLGARAHVRAGASLRRAVVWPDAVVTGALEDAVVTPFATWTSPASGPGSR